MTLDVGKPRIKRPNDPLWPDWICQSFGDMGVHVCGGGSSPVEAYSDWSKKAMDAVWFHAFLETGRRQ